MNRKSVFASVLATLLICFVFWKFSQTKNAPPRKSFSSPPRHTAIDFWEVKDTDFVGDPVFTERYLSQDGSAEEDLQILSDLVLNMVFTIKDLPRYPIADMADLTAILAGKNRAKLSWIGPGDDVLHSSGAMRDRWGSPLILHRNSALDFEIRSMGEDKIPYTQDDVVRRTSFERKSFKLLK